LHKDENLFAVKLKVGVFDNDAEELSRLVEMMFNAWKRMCSSYRWNGYLKNYDGICKRLFFEYDGNTGLFSPFFYLLCIRKKVPVSESEEYLQMIENEKLRVQTYIKWFSSWARTLKICSPVSVDFSLVELESLERVLSEFCTNEKYTLLPLIDEVKKSLLKKASGNGRHKLVSFQGIFKDMNRRLTVER